MSNSEWVLVHFEYAPEMSEMAEYYYIDAKFESEEGTRTVVFVKPKNALLDKQRLWKDPIWRLATPENFRHAPRELKRAIKKAYPLLKLLGH